MVKLRKDMEAISIKIKRSFLEWEKFICYSKIWVEEEGVLT